MPLTGGGPAGSDTPAVEAEDFEAADGLLAEAGAGAGWEAAAGADSRLLTLGWLDAEQGTALRLHTGRIGARVGVFAPPGDPEHSGTIHGARLWDAPLA